MTQLDLQLSETAIEITSDDWYSPPWLFEALNCNFELDVCAPRGGVTWIPAAASFDLSMDGLAQDWHGMVWMNPPYSDPLPWVRKFVEHGDGIALVPTSNGRWMVELWAADTDWLMLPPMRFAHGVTRQLSKGSIPNRCWLVAIGKKAKMIMAESGIGLCRELSTDNAQPVRHADE
jgi:hypothetical protein